MPQVSPSRIWTRQDFASPNHPLLTITQLRRTIGTNIDGSDVFVSQHIVDTSHIRAQGIFGVVRLQITPAHIGSSLHVIEFEVVGIKSMSGGCIQGAAAAGIIELDAPDFFGNGFVGNM